MQRKQQKSTKRNTEEIWKTLEDRKRKKRHSEGENYQDDLQQKGYLDGQIKGMTKNTGQGWKEIGDDGKEEGQEGKEPWKQ